MLLKQRAGRLSKWMELKATASEELLVDLACPEKMEQPACTRLIFWEVVYVETSNSHGHPFYRGMCTWGKGFTIL